MIPPDPAPSATYATGWHAPVLVRECCDALAARRTEGGTGLEGAHLLDGTLGGGGHTAALLERGAQVVGIDRDANALEEARGRLAGAVRSGAFEAVEGNHDDIDAILALTDRTFDGILLDLGVSSRQFDEDARGFSFRAGVPLDMRMDPHAEFDAAAFLNDSEEAELARVFKEYGDEPKARRLAGEVVHRRQRQPFATSDDLVGAIRAVLGSRSGAPEFARLFQAVRIAVNDEIGGLARGLVALRDRLAPGGVIAVITYHSGEDRIVKHAFRDWSTACTCPPRQPICNCGGVSLGEVVTKRAITASEGEVAVNPRARSAHLRVWRKAEA
ncbi:MAG: 16S rRNA (cytosine(1402)-N(4))-methyltransferase RsmH [Gemmatimonadetes bacterium]|nr:16S rRNA (cytosine(1402)-N(4))-methyltransferase RsmH [Gemmatimonadota bacterium]MBP7549198.1 16S rRNA (cytosine(1402)-N(4))-methyltransferase RsmH [Gemmatimonadaceae bacterium]